MVGSAVVDAWAALAFLRRENLADRTMRRYLKRAQKGNLRLLMNIINLGETYYRMVQVAGEEKAGRRLALFRRLPVEIVQARETLVMEAARLKARHPLSYADAFAVATARIHDATILTGDPEILALSRQVVKTVSLRG